MNGISKEFIIFSDLYRCVVSRFSIRRLLCNRLYQSCAQFQDFHQMAKMNSLRLECKPSWLSELRISFTFESSPSSVSQRYALTEDLNYNNPVTQETALLCTILVKRLGTLFTLANIWVFLSAPLSQHNADVDSSKVDPPLLSGEGVRGARKIE